MSPRRGPRTAEANVPARRPVPSGRSGRRSQRRRRPDGGGANPGALFITSNELVAPCGPTAHPDRDDPPAAGNQKIEQMQRISGFRRMGDPGLEPGTSSLSEKPMGETSGRDRPRKSTKVLQKRADQHRRPKPPESARTHRGGRGMDVLRRGWPGSIRGYASRRLGQGRDGLAGCRVPGGGRERSPDVARGVVPAVPCRAGTALRRA